MNTTNPSTHTEQSTSRSRRFRRVLVGMAILITLVIGFYTVENWRGQHAWEKRRNELRAQGEIVDWSAYISAPVPNEQNFFKAPHMEEWFVRRSFLEPGASSPNAFNLSPKRTETVTFAHVTVVNSDSSSASQPAGDVLDMDDPASAQQVKARLQEWVGPYATGAQNFILLAKPLNQFESLNLKIRSKKSVTRKQLSDWFPWPPVTNSMAVYDPSRDFKIETPIGSSNEFALYLSACLNASDYLESTQPLVSDFDLVRKALERPFSRIDCDYSQPFLISIPNFVSLRTMAQVLSQRAQSYLLLGQSEAAWHELETLHNLDRITLPRPEPKPITLVGAMINTAIQGIFVNVIEDGLRLHAWREPQLKAMEQVLRENDLLSPLLQSLKEEQVASSHTFETMSSPDLRKLLKSAFRSQSDFSWKLLSLVPRGWLYQNMVLGTKVEENLLKSIDVSRGIVLPESADRSYVEIEKELKHVSPYNFLVAITMPNFSKAVQTVAFNQNLMHEAQVACALERYHLEKKQFPETLNVLVPDFLSTVPQDVIGGKPLQYRRNNDGTYRLYSVGWNQVDDGGTVGKTRMQGDWVWQMAN